MKEPTLENLTLMVWSDCEKNKHHLKILNKISDQYHIIGIQLGLDQAEINNFYKKAHEDNVECCIQIFSKWIENDGCRSKFPKTWRGLRALLDVIEKQSVETELLKALATYGIYM